MAERPLREVQADEPPRGGVPGWLWGCGGGCLLLVALVIGFTVWFFNQVQKEAGPEAAWPEIERVLPFEARPEGQAFLIDPQAWARRFGGWFGASEEDLANVPAGRLAGFGHEDGSLVLMFMGDAPDMDVPDDADVLEFDLQGRTVRGRRFTPSDDEEDLRVAGVGRGVPLIEIDIGDRYGEPVSLIVQSGSADIGPEDVQRLLAPFDVWATADDAAPAPIEDATVQSPDAPLEAPVGDDQ